MNTHSADSFLVIENDSVCPVEAFILLGVSTSRGDESSIGQFGTGAKHGVLTLLRAELEPVIFLGATEVKAFTKTQIVKNQPFERVFFSVDDEVEATSMTLTFGELDWTDAIEMALREFISNALDQCEQDWNKINIYVHSCSKSGVPVGESDTTRVYIPLTKEVRRYLNEINWRFLHPTNRENISVLEKETKSVPKFYRKGVYIREGGKNELSLFDYNFGEEAKIDESRNLDSYRTSQYAIQTLTSDVEKTTEVLRLMSRGEYNFYEAGMSSWGMDYTNTLIAWKKLISSIQTEKEFILCKDIVENNIAIRKGYYPVHISSDYANGWYEALLRYPEIKTASSMFSGLERDGYKIKKPTKKCVDACKNIWSRLKKLDLTGEYDFPEVYQFTAPIDKEGSKTLGFYFEDAIYLSDEFCTNKRVIIEELAHHISKAHDGTRDFEDYLFAIICKLWL